ncbi:DUF4836 family protein [Chitinophaga sp. GCM10012297]|uniref:DUF4836 family protein n=1 Tax=Chitinophaga chungangae TaxID=2821488 RepID=A0ABS3YDQ2_9BACT|nr:DUF4836 family protein [Chitinophaga chungangae]MBO9152803.1 DUF4836 family protein [Chitinophaga chungangae]
MKRMISRTLLVLSGAAVLLLSACSKTPEQGKHIPKNAAMVLGVNSEQIQEKLVKDGLTVDKLFDAVQSQDTSSSLAKAMKDAENSGVDMKGDVFIAMVPGEAGAKGYVAAYAKLKDAAKFEAFIKEKSKKEVKAGTDFKYVEDKNAIVGFSNETIIGVFAFDPTDFERHNPYAMDDFGDSAAAAPAPAKTANNTETLNKLFHLKKDESIATVESFKEVQKEKGDAFFWMSSEQVYAFNPGTPSGMAALMTGNIKKLTEGAYTAAAIHFENGKIKVNSKSYAGKEMQDIMKKYPMEKVNMDMIENYPSGNVFGFAIMNFDLRMLGDILKLLGMDGFANMGLAEAQLTLDDILKAFKGELAIVGSDFSATSAAQKPDIKFVFNMKVGDKAAFEKVMSSKMVAPMFTKVGENYVPQQPLGEIALSINDKRILVASDEALLTTYDAGKSKAKLDDVAVNAAKGSVFSVYLDIEKIVNNMPEESLKELPDSISNDIKGLLKNLTVSTEPFSGNTQKSVLELNFKNESQNTLAQMVNFTKKMWGYYEANKFDSRSQQATDSTVDANVIVDSAVAVPVQ